jgi:hypothetical protein
MMNELPAQVLEVHNLAAGFTGFNVVIQCPHCHKPHNIFMSGAAEVGVRQHRPVPCGFDNGKTGHDNYRSVFFTVGDPAGDRMQSHEIS